MKFTERNGSITVHILKSAYENLAIIKIEDSGGGMTREEQDRIFDLYYQGNKPYTRSSSGIGLALTKDFLELHKGKITVNSVPGHGSTFTISLQLGNAHFEKDEINNSFSPAEFEHSPAHLLELKQQQFPLENAVALSSITPERSIMIIEDNDDLRSFLKAKLHHSYEILEAADALSAREQVFNTLPDLIICDIMLPDQSGLDLTQLFKTDIRTSHIPIILLSAQTNIEHKIEGMRNKADAYLTKPFNIHYLDETISSLLANRNRLRDHFITDPGGLTNGQGIKKGDKKFLNEFSAYIETNIGNPDLSVDDICKNIGISKVQLYRKIKSSLGINVNDYILNTRLNKAKYLLQNDNLSISEISYTVGFSSASYFSTVFKAKFKTTPKEYRQN
jgi:DNA-binding response OmpR family regulator